MNKLKPVKHLKGIAVSPGVAIGRAFVFLREDSFNIPLHKIKKAEVSVEIARFEDAITRTRAEILGIRKLSMNCVCPTSFCNIHCTIRAVAARMSEIS